MYFTIFSIYSCALGYFVRQPCDSKKYIYYFYYSINLLRNYTLDKPIPAFDITTRLFRRYRSSQ